MVTLPPWLVGVCAVYIVALTAIFAYLFHEQWSRLRALKAKARVDPLKLDGRPVVDCPGDIWHGRPYAAGAVPDPVEQADADTPEQQEIARLRALAAADAAEGPAPTRSPYGADVLIVEIYKHQTEQRFKGIYGEDGQA